MAIDINSLRKVTADHAPMTILYGPEKIGKTSLTATWPSPVSLQLERGTPEGITLDSFGVLDTFDDVMDAMGVLASEDHPFTTVNVDTTSKLQPVIWAETCKRNNWSSIEQAGFGKGYVEADYIWEEFLTACCYLRDKRGMMVNLLAHAVTVKFDDPETQSYSRYEIDLHKRSMAILTREADAILLLKKDVTIKLEGPQAKKGDGRARADGGDSRWLYAQGRPAFQAGNRLGLPAKLMIPEKNGFSVLAPYYRLKQPETTKAAAASKKAA